MLTPLLPLIRNAMLLTDLIPDISLLIPQSYEEIKTPETEKLLASFLTQAETSAAPKLIHMSGIPGAGKSTFYRRHRWNKHVLSVLTPLWNNSPPIGRNCKTPVPLRLSKMGNPGTHHRLWIAAPCRESAQRYLFDHGGVTPAHVNLMKTLKTMAMPPKCTTSAVRRK